MKRIKESNVLPPEVVMNAVDKIWQESGIPSFKDTVVFTYGDTCHTPKPLSDDLHVHELVHTEQQAREGMTPDLWWQKMADDKEFRYAQELEAYRKQYKFIQTRLKKAQAFEMAKLLAVNLSSKMYGEVKSFHQALADIVKP